MIDLSNNNGGVIDFKKVYAAGHRRVYHKLTEGNFYLDGFYRQRSLPAAAAKLKFGPYAFARPSRCTPREDAMFFLENLPVLSKQHGLRPMLDLEDNKVLPSRRIGLWAKEWVNIVEQHSGHIVVVYGSAPYLEACQFDRAPGPLLVASYGRNDGVEHPFYVPRPWRSAAAHQFTSTGHCPGVGGRLWRFRNVDLSHVYQPDKLDIHFTR